MPNSCPHWNGDQKGATAARIHAPMLWGVGAINRSGHASSPNTGLPIQRGNGWVWGAGLLLDEFRHTIDWGG